MAYFTHHFEATVALHPVGTYHYTVVYLDGQLHKSLPMDSSPRLRMTPFEPSGYSITSDTPVTLRPMTEQDLPALHDWLNRPNRPSPE